MIQKDTLILLHAEIDQMKKINGEHIPRHFYLHLTWYRKTALTSVSYKTRNQPKPPITSQNYPKPAELSKNNSNKRRFRAAAHL